MHRHFKSETNQMSCCHSASFGSHVFLSRFLLVSFLRLSFSNALTSTAKFPAWYFHVQRCLYMKLMFLCGFQMLVLLTFHTNESLNNNFMVNIYVTTNYKGDDLIISWNVYSFVCSAQQMKWRHNVKQKRVNVFLIHFVINWCKIDDERTVFICVYCVKVRWFESRHCIIVTHSKCASVW